MGKLNSTLLIDDDSINNFINERLIKKMGISDQVKVVLNGEEAIAHLSNLTKENKPGPELILLDINMPVMDGFEFLEAYQKVDVINKKGIVIVMLTTSTNPNDTSRLNNSGASGYINKPLTEEKLQDILKKYFNQ